jgi:hypothetical protein
VLVKGLQICCISSDQDPRVPPSRSYTFFDKGHDYRTQTMEKGQCYISVVRCKIARLEREREEKKGTSIGDGKKAIG